MKRRNDQSTYKFNGAITTISLQFCHIFYLSCIKFLLKVCSNHGIIEMDYFYIAPWSFRPWLLHFGGYPPLEPKLALWFFFIANSEYWE